MTVRETNLIRTKFFDYLFGDNSGYLCVASGKPRDRQSFKQMFFKWPDHNKQLTKYINENQTGHNMWFCVNLLSKPERKKEFCLPTNLVWADLDACRPSIVEPVPQCALETSPNRFQAVWRLDENVDPYIAEEYSKRIAYKFSDSGADPSGWDLTQLLRIPLTYNYKYDNPDEGVPPPTVELLQSFEALLPPQVFDALPSANGTGEAVEAFPDPISLPEADAVIYKFLHHLNATPFKQLYTTQPNDSDDWSKIMWRLINICLEAGMSNAETFAVVQNAECNKYRRDNRSGSYLWREVLKAEEQQRRLSVFEDSFKPMVMPELVTKADLKGIKPSFVDNYVNWAKEATDAVEEYHELTAFVMLSSIMASGIKLHTSYGPMVPNLWGLVLGDSTLTRKTTAMQMGMSIIMDVELDMVLATDGSAEGLLTGLTTRPNRTSIFFKDEVSGFVDAIKRKDYMAGMLELFAQLYDVPPILTRRLRKETYTITDPVFIFFGGGIRDKMYSLLTDEHILSGFLPRFLVVSGEADTSKIRVTGPRTQLIDDKRQALLKKAQEMYDTYVQEGEIDIGGTIITQPITVEAVLSDKAWERYGAIEMEMVRAASDSPISMYALPTFERLSRSILKMATLLAASRQKPKNNEITVEEYDVIKAASYVQRWGRHTIDLIYNVGRGTTQRSMDKWLATVIRNPGITRSKLMQMYHATKREADEILGSLDERGQIRMERAGRGHKLFPM